MSDLRLDPLDDDLLLDEGDLVLVDGLDEIAQLMAQRMRLFQGEWFLDTDAGIPYYDEILKKKPDIVVVDGIFKQTALDTPGVLGLEEFEMDYDGVERELSISLKARTVDGVLDFSEELP